MRTIEDIEYVLYTDSAEGGEILGRIRNAIPRAHYLKADEKDVRQELDVLRQKNVESKKIILLHPFQGRLVQKCPGSPGVICCNYQLINSGFNCLYDCVYCFLLGYLNSYGILVFDNYRDIIAQTEKFCTEADPDKIYRIGTGEFTDSLMIDELTDFSRTLIKCCAVHENIFLELKTKSSNIGHLCKIENKGNTVIGWSLNTPRNIAESEFGTASLEERIAAAVRASESGFKVSFHFDPVIRYNGWKKDYIGVLDSVFSKIEMRNIAWISAGGFRFTGEFKTIMRKYFPDESITVDDFIPCPDGKFRYFKPLRAEIYALFRDYMRQLPDPPFFYMCMESSDMWDLVFGKEYLSSDDLERDMCTFLKNRYTG